MASMNYIALARGDCKMINVTLLSNGQPIEPDPTDTVELTVREKNDPESPVLLYKASAPGSSLIELHAEDTRALAPGRYSADVRFRHDGCVYTIWGVDDSDTRIKNLKNFYVMAGVSENE